MTFLSRRDSTHDGGNLRQAADLHGSLAEVQQRPSSNKRTKPHCIRLQAVLLGATHPYLSVPLPMSSFTGQVHLPRVAGHADHKSPKCVEIE